MQRLLSVKQNIQKRILIRKLYPPSHAGECEFGFSLVFCENKWQFEIAFYAATNSANNKGFDYIDIPDDMWVQNPYEALRDLVLKEARLDTYIEGRGSCIEWEKLENLFESNRKFSNT